MKSTQEFILNLPEAVEHQLATEQQIPPARIFRSSKVFVLPNNFSQNSQGQVIKYCQI